MENYAGRHLIIDGVFGPESISKMADRTFLAQYLEDVTEITNMTLVFPPIAMSFPYSGETNRLLKNLIEEGKCNDSVILNDFKKHIDQRNTLGAGVSAIAVWLESHCSLHSWTEQNYISIDLFSCKEYDIVPVINHTIKALGLIDGSILVVDRMMNGLPPKVKQLSMQDFLVLN